MDDLAQAVAALRVDRVVATQQVPKLYGVTRSALVKAGALTRFERVRGSGRAAKLHTVEFVSFEPRLPTMQPMQLVHCAGTAALRGVLGAPHEEWRAEAGAFGATYQPDAVWEREDGETAIEYDTGWYKAITVRRKAGVFEAFAGGQLWGVPAASRVRFVERETRAAGAQGVRVLHAPWFD